MNPSGNKQPGKTTDPGQPPREWAWFCAWLRAYRAGNVEALRRAERRIRDVLDGKPVDPPHARRQPPKVHDRRFHRKGRLPHGATFHAEYDAHRGVWAGALQLPLPSGQWKMFRAELSALFSLLHKLDDQYRAALAGAAAAIAEATADAAALPDPKGGA